MLRSTAQLLNDLVLMMDIHGTSPGSYILHHLMWIFADITFILLNGNCIVLCP